MLIVIRFCNLNTNFVNCDVIEQFSKRDYIRYSKTIGNDLLLCIFLLNNIHIFIKTSNF